MSNCQHSIPYEISILEIIKPHKMFTGSSNTSKMVKYSNILLFIVFVSVIDTSSSYSSGEDRSSGRYTREIRIKQGSLRGLVLEPSIIENLQNVDMYLGIPYAAPPIGTQRFMPPGSPPQWTGVKMADRFGPVCPQNLPDFSSEPGKTMSEGRYNSLKRLLPYLNNQSEDCLYLNIYTPAQGGSRAVPKYPVIVFIHGESFEWNSGNPYDGSVLASYGHVILVTINFRLGILGFLKPGIGEHTVSNFGLLDQIAALQWVKENIGAFGGDMGSVTLMGHGTGAACANFLLVSPVSNGLFHRAILMSGTALSDWALTPNPIQFTIQVAEALNCPSNDELAGCLRRKRLSEIMKVRVQIPPFRTPFGPVIDGSVVPNEPTQTMGVYKDLFSRYELLYGITEVESYHLLDAVSLHLGMLERERDKLLREYVQSRFEFVPDLALAKTLYEYTHWRPITSRPIAEQHRDSLLEILSDARVASPLVQTADFHSSANPKSYFYVFTHSTKHGDFAEANIGGSVHGEELPYVFGVPMDSGRFPQSFTTPEKLFSEAMMTYWTNFAKTGNPNAPRRLAYLSQGPRDWRQYDIDWPEYDSKNQTYLNLGIPPKYGHQYRKQPMNFWNQALPNQLKNPTKSSPRLVNPPHLHDIDPRMEVSPPWNRPPPKSPQDRYENFAKPYYENARPTKKPTYGTIVHEEGGRGKGLMDRPSLYDEETSTILPPITQTGNSSMALTIVIIIGICFLVVNLCAFAALYYQRDRLKAQERIMKRRIDENIRLEEEGTYVKRVKLDLKSEKELKEGGDVIYEAVSKKTGEVSSDNVANMKRWQRQGSTSTMDAHTKVREWIQQEIVQRCSPRFLRRTRQQIQQQKLDRERQLGTSTETSLSIVPKNSGSMVQRDPGSKTPTLNTLQRKVKKVSVAVDATPAARSASVQKQVPIELSKSLDALTNLTVAHRPILKRSNTTMDENLIKQDSPKVLRRSTTSINLLPFVQKEEEEEEELEPLRIQHGHSHSEPVPFTIPFLADLDPDIRSGNSQSTKPQMVPIPVEKDTKTYVVDHTQPMSTFPKQQKKLIAQKRDASVTTGHYHDINVTSRDSDDDMNRSSEDPLANMQRRNFPKVLPDLPVEHFGDEIYSPKQAAMKRRSLPPSNILLNLLTPVSEADGNSQPSTPTNKKPPPPPPRISSTLGRKPSNTSPIIGSEIRRAPYVVQQSTKSAPPTVQRQEPKIIIKPTSTNPVTRNPKTQIKNNQNVNIPRVTANNELRPSKTQTTGRAIPLPVQKTAQTAPSGKSTDQSKALAPVKAAEIPRKTSTKNSETSTDDDNSSNTGTIKRVQKVDKKN